MSQKKFTDPDTFFEETFKSGGGPAFPFVYGSQYVFSGMTRRDYFAGLALQGLMARENGTVDIGGDFPGQRRAEVCVLMADALIKVLDK